MTPQELLCVLALAAGAVDVKDLTLREKALWDENNHLRDFAEINYTGAAQGHAVVRPPPFVPPTVVVA